MNIVVVGAALPYPATSGNRIRTLSLLIRLADRHTITLLGTRNADRVTPLGQSDRALPPCTQTALEMVNAIRASQDPHGRSAAGLSTLVAGAFDG